MSTRVTHPKFTVTDELRNRFFSRCQKIVGGCWIWSGAVTRATSYGAVKIEGKKIDAHVAAYRIEHDGDPVPLGHLVMHKCNCRMCVNPEHLKLGTHSENMKHAYQTTSADLRPLGEDVYNSVLTEQAVRDIRETYAKGGISQAAIAKKYGVDSRTIGSVVNRRSWKHVK